MPTTTLDDMIRQMEYKGVRVQQLTTGEGNVCYLALDVVSAHEAARMPFRSFRSPMLTKPRDPNRKSYRARHRKPRKP